MGDPKILAANLLQKHFPKFGTFRKSCTYKETGDASYNTSTGVPTPVVISTQANVQMIFDSAAKYATSFPENVDIKETDEVVIFPQLDLVVTPSVNDLIIDDQGTTWNVVAIGKDPGPVHYELLVRPRG